MEKKKILIKIFVVTLFILLIYFIFGLNNVFAAVELKPSNTVHSSLSLRDCFFNSYNMRNAGSSLGTNNLDPHLATAEDWGIAAYLSLSNYGVFNKNNAYGHINRTINGFKVNINSYQFATTTGNVTGVMNLGKTRTFVSGYDENSLSSLDYLNGYDRLVTKFTGASNTTGMAITELKDFESSGVDSRGVPPDSNMKSMIRQSNAVACFPNEDDGTRSNTASYRPVIWNY